MSVQLFTCFHLFSGEQCYGIIHPLTVIVGLCLPNWHKIMSTVKHFDGSVFLNSTVSDYLRQEVKVSSPLHHMSITKWYSASET